MLLGKKKSKKPLSLKEFAERRNKVLVKRRVGGHGDILMQRMMFEDFHRVFPDIKLSFTVPPQFIALTRRHPHLEEKEALDIRNVDESQFGCVYDITTACRVHETKYAPSKDHRSDIWAGHCGVTLLKHDMHLSVRPDVLEKCRMALASHNPQGLPVVALSTYSTPDEFGIGKSLTEEQISWLVYGLKERGLFPVAMHGEHKPIFDQLEVIQYNGMDIEYWMGMVQASDYVVTVDTALFHMGGGLKRPMTAIFTFTDGKVYGKYYQFILVQRHRDNKNWDCGPCFVMQFCPKEQGPRKPCLTGLTREDLLDGVDEMLKQWPGKVVVPQARTVSVAPTPRPPRQTSESPISCPLPTFPLGGRVSLELRNG